MPIEKLLKKFHWFDIKQFLSFSGGDLMFQMTGIVSELIVLKLVDRYMAILPSSSELYGYI